MDATLLGLFNVLNLRNIIFFVFAGLAVAGAIGAAFAKNIVYSAFSLLGSLFGVAALFAWLSADYLAITQLIVYVGGILVLFLFAVMLTNRITERNQSNPITNLGSALLVGTALAGFLIYVAVKTPWATVTPTVGVTTHAIGNALLSQYLLPFEVLSLLILGALIGAVMVARKEVRED